MFTLRSALVALGEADTTPTVGLIALCNGNANPILVQDHLGNATTPRVTFFFLPAGEGTQSGKRSPVLQAVSWVHPNDATQYIQLGESIRDRLWDLWRGRVGGGLAGEGVNAAPINPQWFDVPSESDDGIVGFGLELTFMNAE